MSDDLMQELAREQLPKKGVDPADEGALIGVVEAGVDLKLVHYAAILLRNVGTAAAIPALKKAMGYRKQDVKISALSTLADIARDSEAAFYHESLIDKKYREKWAALYALARYGDAAAMSDVVARLKKLLARKTNREMGKETEVVLAAKYLARFDGDPTAHSGLDLIAANWDKLNPPEQQELQSTIPRLQGPL